MPPSICVKEFFFEVFIVDQIFYDVGLVQIDTSNKQKKKMSSSSSSSRTRSRYHSNRQESDQIVAHFNGSNENLVHIKFLLPGSVTGSVIGKGGEKIASLQKQTNTKMKMSKAGVNSSFLLSIK